MRIPTGAAREESQLKHLESFSMRSTQHALLVSLLVGTELDLRGCIDVYRNPGRGPVEKEVVFWLSWRHRERKLYIVVDFAANKTRC